VEPPPGPTVQTADRRQGNPAYRSTSCPTPGAEPPLDPVVDRVDGLVVRTPPEPGSTEDVTAALTFRVGVVDETIRTRGITHMVEYLAVSRFHADTLSWNGSVDLTRERFTARGPAGEVTRFLNEVMGALSALPGGPAGP